MKLLTGIVIAGSLILAQSAFACSTYECKKKAALSDTTLSMEAREELKEFYAKSDEVYQEYRNKKAELKGELSAEAQKIYDKHHMKKASKPSKKSASAKKHDKAQQEAAKH